VFHVAVIETCTLAEFDASHFHPNQVIGIVDHAHLVGLSVAYAKARFGGRGHANKAL